MSYIYGWDTENRKKRYMGKYPDANPNARGYYGKNEAGQFHELIPKDAGVKREFKGSPSTTYTFYKPSIGYYTVTARTFADALQQAKLRGYTRKDYKAR